MCSTPLFISSSSYSSSSFTHDNMHSWHEFNTLSSPKIVDTSVKCPYLTWVRCGTLVWSTNYHPGLRLGAYSIFSNWGMEFGREEHVCTGLVSTNIVISVSLNLSVSTSFALIEHDAVTQIQIYLDHLSLYPTYPYHIISYHIIYIPEF